MMPDVRITRLHKRYRLPAIATDERSRLDRVLASAMRNELLDAALARAGVRSDDLICVRRVESTIRLDRSNSDWQLGVVWSVALADAVAARVQEAGPDVVRYRSRHFAIADMACSAAAGVLERAWAWRSLGIWRAGDAMAATTAPAEVVRILADDARVAPAVLCEVARRGLLPLLVTSAADDRWTALARAVLVDSGASASSIHRLLFDDDPGAGAGDESPSAIAGTSRLRARSPLLRALNGVAWGEPAAAAVRLRALAVLAMMEREPALAILPDAAAVVRALAQLPAAGSDVRAERDGAARRAERSVASDSRTLDDTAVAPEPAVEETDTAPVGDAGRTQGVTLVGGLPFLLHTVGSLGLPGALVNEPALAARSLRWTLHQLALMIAPIAPDDPAALAFAGLPPGAAPPCAGEPPSTDDEQALLRSTCGPIVAALRQRLGSSGDESDADLLYRIVARRAEVVADPAWIEIRFAADSVSIDVRRAGLDLDPGWLPWLGVVVRFAYV